MSTKEPAMSITTPAGAETASSSRSLSTAFSLGAVFATLGSLGYISLNGFPPREAAAHPLALTAGFVASVGILILSLALMRWRTDLPGWTVVSSAAGLWFAGPLAWGWSTTFAAAAANTDNALFETLFFESPLVLLGTVPKALLCLVGFLAMAITGWRRRCVPRLAAVVLGIAAVLSLWPPYPPALILASLAFFLIARSGVAIR